MFYIKRLWSHNPKAIPLYISIAVLCTSFQHIIALNPFLVTTQNLFPWWLMALTKSNTFFKLSWLLDHRNVAFLRPREISQTISSTTIITRKTTVRIIHFQPPSLSMRQTIICELLTMQANRTTAACAAVARRRRSLWSILWLSDNEQTYILHFFCSLYLSSFVRL